MLTTVWPSLSAADADAHESDETIDFSVTLNEAAPSAVTVNYATSDGTAWAGADYTAASGTLTFAADETSRTVSVTLLDDTHDDDETFALQLSDEAATGIGTRALAHGGGIRRARGNRARSRRQRIRTHRHARRAGDSLGQIGARAQRLDEGAGSDIDRLGQLSAAREPRALAEPGVRTDRGSLRGSSISPTACRQ